VACRRRTRSSPGWEVPDEQEVGPPTCLPAHQHSARPPKAAHQPHGRHPRVEGRDGPGHPDAGGARAASTRVAGTCTALSESRAARPRGPSPPAEHDVELPPVRPGVEPVDQRPPRGRPEREVVGAVVGGLRVAQQADHLGPGLPEQLDRVEHPRRGVDGPVGGRPRVRAVGRVRRSPQGLGLPHQPDVGRQVVRLPVLGVVEGERADAHPGRVVPEGGRSGEHERGHGDPEQAAAVLHLPPNDAPGASSTGNGAALATVTCRA
jgi:hypothetical protein